MKIANNLEEFNTKVSNALMTALNNKEGQELTTQLAIMKLEENPNLTKEEWQKTKEEFFTFCFVMALKENKDLMNEYGGYIYDMLRG